MQIQTWKGKWMKTKWLKKQHGGNRAQLRELISYHLGIFSKWSNMCLPENSQHSLT